MLLPWDGVRHHTGENMKNFLGEQNEGLENPVEAIWFQLKNLLRRFYRFGKNFKIINFLFEFFAKYNLFKFPNLKRFDAFSQLI